MRALGQRLPPLVVALALVPGGVGLAHAGPREDAQVHFEAAAELYAKEDYEAAAREFALAYALDPRLDILFAWAQAERLAGDWVDAHRLFERLLARDDLSDSQREAIATLDAEVRAAAEAEGIDIDATIAADFEAPDTNASPASDAPATADSDDHLDRARPAHRRTLGIGLAAAGGVLVAGGAGLLVAGIVLDRRVSQADSYAQFDERYDPATSRGRGAVGLYAGGGIAVGVGLAILIAGAVNLARANSGAETPRVVVAADATGLRVRW